jgi:uncharacterized protein Veg
MTESDPAFGQIVGGKFECDFIASENSNSIAAQTTGQMGEDYSLMFQLHAEQTAGKFLQYGTSYFYAVFLTHSTLLIPHLVEGNWPLESKNAGTSGD